MTDGVGWGEGVPGGGQTPVNPVNHILKCKTRRVSEFLTYINKYMKPFNCCILRLNAQTRLCRFRARHRSRNTSAQLKHTNVQQL